MLEAAPPQILMLDVGTPSRISTPLVLVPAAVLLVVAFLVALYRLTLHPLARFPGPKAAAATGLYEAYFECVKDGGGRYWVEIEEMHRRYGPIVRINPNELHIADPNWNAVYRYSAKSAKPAWFYMNFFGRFPSTNSATSHALHQLRRAPLQAYFASANIQRYVPAVEGLVGRLCGRLREAAVAKNKTMMEMMISDEDDGKKKGGKEYNNNHNNNNNNAAAHEEREDEEDDDEDAVGGVPIVNLSDAFRCLATDVATGFAFGTPFGHLEEPTFDREFNRSVKTVVRAGMWSRHCFGLVLPLLHGMPEAVASRLNPAFGRMMISCVQRSMDKPEPAPGAHPDMIQTLLASDLPAEEKTFPRLFSESRSVIMAGTETTATTLVTITASLLGDPAKLERLRAELREAERTREREEEEGGGGGARRPEGLGYAELKQLPYLTGVVNEGLRLANPTPSRLPRVCEDQDLMYGNWSIPRGTTVSVTTQDTHHDAKVFARPREFLPERWEDPEERRRLNRYLSPWGRGTRLCLGMELATVDIYLTVSRLFGPGAGFDMRMYRTTEADWRAYHEWFAAFPKGKGLRVLIVKGGGAAAAEVESEKEKVLLGEEKISLDTEEKVAFD
ncbi:putative cytochrome P450 [Xylariomycetidae sp. FL2044]|nr:putative cytochrome P450 [Xylariomycetidae sp. FL2044]